MGPLAGGLTATTLGEIRARLACTSLRCSCHSRQGNTHCPSHDDRNPSLNISEKMGTILFHCFAGCPQADVLSALGFHGAAPGATAGLAKVAKAANGVGSSEDLSNFARAIWASSVSAAGTLVERYLRARGIEGCPLTSIRFAGALLHRPSGLMLPAMIAAVTRWSETEVRAIHRTYLLPDGSGKAAVDPAKMALGPVGGGAVWLGAPEERLVLAEGIETALSVQISTGMPSWAVLSASNLRNLILPELPLAKEIVIAADNDPAGMHAAYDAAQQWTNQGRLVRIAKPPRGRDFNDLLRGEL